MNRTYTHTSQLDFTLSNLPKMEWPGKVLMITPTYFNVEYVINPHMEGQIGQVDRTRARQEWNSLKEAYHDLGMDVHILEGVEGLPDMIFCANQSLPFLDKEGGKKAVMSKMFAPQRKEEVTIVEEWLQSVGYQTITPDLSDDESFEGMGDALWHPGKRLLWGGYGFRTSVRVYEQLAEILEAPVLALELTDENFYHLDTCMCLLNESAVMIYPGAFTDGGLQLIHSVFETVIEVNRKEAENGLAVNAACPDGQNVLIHKGLTNTNSKLKSAGFTVHEHSTTEFLKSGGSVFCMKLFYW